MTDRKRDPLPDGYQFGDGVFVTCGDHADVLFQRYLRDNFRNRERFADNDSPSKEIANLVDDAAMRAAYETIPGRPL